MRLTSKVFAAFILLSSVSVVAARNIDGQYDESPLHDWFQHLSSKKGLCCSQADGYTVSDVDWKTQDGHYQVHIPKTMGSTELVWVEVPDEAVIEEPNRFGRTMVWPTYYNGEPEVRCFLPGAET